MSTGKNSSIESIFEHLDRWRHLPAYRLEPRADIFFALYLPEVLGEHFKTEINPLLIPEFPIKKGENNASYKADYLAIEKGNFPARAFLVELKTDMASRRGKQDEYLVCAICAGLRSLVYDILVVCKGNKNKAKYGHLLWHLSELGLIEGCTEALYEYAAPVPHNHPKWKGEASRRGRNYARALEDVKPAEISWPKMELVYVQPQHGEDGASNDVIDFIEFARSVETALKDRGESDGVGRAFVNWLKVWANETAGSRNPSRSSP